MRDENIGKMHGSIWCIFTVERLIDLICARSAGVIEPASLPSLRRTSFSNAGSSKSTVAGWGLQSAGVFFGSAGALAVAEGAALALAIAAADADAAAAAASGGVLYLSYFDSSHAEAPRTKIASARAPRDAVVGFIGRRAYRETRAAVLGGMLKRMVAGAAGDGSTRAGELLAAKYVLQELLGAGGMGEVWRALHVEMGREVAIKVMLDEHAKNADIVARFLREARTANLVRHPNVVDVLDVGRDDRGAPFLVRHQRST